MPILASVLTNAPKDKDRSLQLANRLTSVAVWPVTVTLMLGAPFFLSLYGADFSSAWPVFLIMMGATGVNLLNSSAGSLMLAKGAMVASLVNSALSSVFIIAIVATTLSRWELYSVSTATLVCNLISTIGIVLYAIGRLEFPVTVGRNIIGSSLALTGVTTLLFVAYTAFL